MQHLKNALLLLFLFMINLVFAQSTQVKRRAAPAASPSSVHAFPTQSASSIPAGLQQKVDEIFAAFDTTTSPGCVVAILKDGKTIYQKGYGMANLEQGIALGPTSVFHVASLSKQFTAAAIVQLSLQGKLSLEANIRDYLPQVPDLGHVITINHLLHHTSGLRDQWDLHKLAGWRAEDLITQQDILEMVQRQTNLNFLPGEEFSYSNTGYTLLGLIVQKVTNLSLRDYTDSVFFKPLGMQHTYFKENHAETIPNRAQAYGQDENGRWKLSLPVYDTYGATGLLTTVEDLARWDAYFYAKNGKQKTFVAAMEQAGTLQEGTRLRYASGLALQEYKGHPVIWHPGSDAGYRSVYLRFPRQHFSVILLGNTANLQAEGLAKQVAALFLPDHGEGKQTTGVKIDSTILLARTGTYIDTLSRFTVEFRFHNGQLFNGQSPLVLINQTTMIDTGNNTIYQFQDNANRVSLTVRVLGNRLTSYQKIDRLTLPANFT